jgi:hypothetical protein
MAPLALVALVGVAAVVDGGSAGGSAGQAAVAAVTVGQTCPVRLPPGTRAAVVGTVRNSGDEVLTVSSFDGDAGTPGNTADDFALVYQSGDANGNGTLDPGETWTYAGSYTLGDADSTNVVGVDAVSAGGTFASDLEACTTDVVQQPVPGVIVGVAPVRGVVLFRVPGSNRFVPLSTRRRYQSGRRSTQPRAPSGSSRR